MNRFRRRDGTEKRQERGREVIAFGPEEDAQIEATRRRFPVPFEAATSAALFAGKKETSVRRRLLRIKKRQVVRGDTTIYEEDEGAEIGTLGS